MSQSFQIYTSPAQTPLLMPAPYVRWVMGHLHQLDVLASPPQSHSYSTLSQECDKVTFSLCSPQPCAVFLPLFLVLVHGTTGHSVVQEARTFFPFLHLPPAIIYQVPFLSGSFSPASQLLSYFRPSSRARTLAVVLTDITASNIHSVDSNFSWPKA